MTKQTDIEQAREYFAKFARLPPKMTAKDAARMFKELYGVSAKPKSELEFLDIGRNAPAPKDWLRKMLRKRSKGGSGSTREDILRSIHSVNPDSNDDLPFLGKDRFRKESDSRDDDELTKLEREIRKAQLQKMKKELDEDDN